MHSLARLLRTAQFIAHHYHNTVTGPTFESDHEFFGETYQAYDAAYDSVIERLIGTDENVDPLEVTLEAAETASGSDLAKSTEAREMFRSVLALESAIQREIEMLLDADEAADAAGDTTVDDGIENLLQGLADDSQKRVYHIKQRIR